MITTKEMILHVRGLQDIGDIKQYLSALSSEERKALIGTEVMFRLFSPRPWFDVMGIPLCVGSCFYFKKRPEDWDKPWGTCVFFPDSFRIIPMVGGRCQASQCRPWLKFRRGGYNYASGPPAGYVQPEVQQPVQMPTGLPKQTVSTVYTTARKVGNGQDDQRPTSNQASSKGERDRGTEGKNIPPGEEPE